MNISRTAFAALAAASLLSGCSALQTSTTGGGDTPPARSGRATNGLGYSAASANTVQAMPAPGACHYRGTGLFAQPDPHCALGALNPAVTQQNLEQRVHDLVCQRRISLARAQAALAHDWPPAYRRYVR